MAFSKAKWLRYVYLMRAQSCKNLSASPCTYKPLSGAVIRYGIGGDEVTKLPVAPYANGSLLKNATAKGPPDLLLLDVQGVHSKKAKQKLMNKTLSYAFKVMQI
jgi:hypothetical protein